MNKFLFLVATLLPFLSSTGQTKNTDLAKIKTIEQAEDFITKAVTTDAKIFTIRAKGDTSKLLRSLYIQKEGFTFKGSNQVYKVLKIDTIYSFRASYIYLSGYQLTKQAIDSLRKLIITKYKAGTPFAQLAAQYNMDGNKTGDTGWFPAKRMVPEFEQAVKNHKKGEIFTVDTPSQDWYHVVLKTHDDTYQKEVTILQVEN
jgi:parvulin-like peptidyl-prolyl isomerase